MNVLPKQRQTRRICSPKCKWVSASPIKCLMTHGRLSRALAETDINLQRYTPRYGWEGSLPNHTHIDSPYMALVYTTGRHHAKCGRKTHQTSSTKMVYASNLHALGKLPITHTKTNTNIHKGATHETFIHILGTTCL